MLLFVSSIGINSHIMTLIVQTPSFLTLLGGASTHFSHVNQSLSKAPILVCADSGAETALAAGRMPDAVIGDLDSLSSEARTTLDPATVHQIDEQESTDFEKCLASIDAPAILAHGFLGDRLDHSLAALNALAKFPDQICLLIGSEDFCFLAPANLELDLPRGTLLSLFPLGEVRGTSEGLYYPIDGLDFSPLGQIGTSNRVTGPVRLTFEARTMLVMLPLDCLDAVWLELTEQV